MSVEKICPRRAEQVSGWSDPGKFTEAELRVAHQAMLCEGSPACQGPERVPYGQGNRATETVGNLLAALNISKSICTLRLAIPVQATSSPEITTTQPSPAESAVSGN